MGKVRSIKGKKGEMDPFAESQGSMFVGQEEGRSERMFDVTLTLKLKPEGGAADTITLLAAPVKGTLVHDMLRLAIEDRRNNAVITAMLDNPSEAELEAYELRRRLLEGRSEEALG